MSTMRVCDLTPTSDGVPRISYQPSVHRALVSYPDVLLILCTQCGGSISMLLHKMVLRCEHIPLVKKCECSMPPNVTNSGTLASTSPPFNVLYQSYRKIDPLSLLDHEDTNGLSL